MFYLVYEKPCMLKVIEFFLSIFPLISEKECHFLSPFNLINSKKLSLLLFKKENKKYKKKNVIVNKQRNKLNKYEETIQGVKRNDFNYIITFLKKFNLNKI